MRFAQGLGVEAGEDDFALVSYYPFLFNSLRQFGGRFFDKALVFLRNAWRLSCIEKNKNSCTNIPCCDSIVAMEIVMAASDAVKNILSVLKNNKNGHEKADYRQSAKELLNILTPDGHKYFEIDKSAITCDGF
jgi:hypothetical protein